MKNHLSKLLTVIISLVVLLAVSFSAVAAQSDDPKSRPWRFVVTLKPGVWYGYTLGPASSGAAYLVDITPLHKSIDGAYVKSVIQVEYDGEQWNDVLRVQLPPEFPKLKVEITVYRPRCLETIYDSTAAVLPGEWNGFPVAAVSQYEGGYLLDLDPLDASVDGAFIQRALIHPEFPWGEWLDILRLQTADWLPPDALNIRMRVYLASKLPLVSDLTVTLTPNDTWSGFVIGPSSLQRGYLVRAIPLSNDAPAADLNQYIIQPEFNGKEWNDVLRVEMRNTDWGQIEYNFKIYACDKKICR